MKHKIIETSEGTFERVSGWIRLTTKWVTEDDYRFEFRFDEEERNDKKWGIIDCFTYKRFVYGFNQFIAIGSAWCAGERPTWQEDGELHAISGVDFYGDLYDPYYLELDADCEKVRLYRKVRCK